MFHRHNDSGCDVAVNPSESRRRWHNGKQGDKRVELWSWEFHLWLDTKGAVSFAKMTIFETCWSPKGWTNTPRAELSTATLLI